MHEGVIRDEARIAIKQRQASNAKELELQQNLEKELRKQQDTVATSPPLNY